MNYGRGALIFTILIGSLCLVMFFIRTFDYQGDIIRLNREMLTLEDRVSLKAGTWVHYLESRVNRVAQSQDEYQSSTSKRIDLLDERIRGLEKRVKDQEEIISSLQKRTVVESPKY